MNPFNKFNKKPRSRMSNTILQSVRDSAIRSGDHSKVLIVDQLQQAYNTIDSIKASYSAMVSVSNNLSKDLKEKDDMIIELQNQNKILIDSMSAMVNSWKSIYELSIYGSSMFNSLPLVNLWIYVDRFFASKNEDEMRSNSLALMDAANKLNNDKLFVDMRNRLTTFSTYYQQNFGDVPETIIKDEENQAEDTCDELESHGNTDEKTTISETSKERTLPVFKDLLTDYSTITDKIEDHDLDDGDIKPDNHEIDE